MEARDILRGRPSRPELWSLILLLVLTTAWAVAFIERTSFVLGEQRYFVLFDDAMVSMTYARNAAAGEGLVWSPGNEPIEGFTNPLWTGWMIVVNLIPLPLPLRSLLVQASGVALLLALIVRVRALLRDHFVPDSRGPLDWLPAAALTAFQYTLVYWAVLGMETILQALLAVLAVHYAYDIVFTGRRRHLALFCVFTLSYLLRMDMVILVFLVGLWVMLQGGFRQRRSWIGGALLLVAMGVAYQAFRLVYFNEWLPNTYTLKVEGVSLGLRVNRGLDKMLESLKENWALALTVLAAVLSSRSRRSRTLLPGLLFAAYVGYSIWVGGDAWELPEVNLPYNRFVVFLLPLAFVVINDLLNRMVRVLAPTRRRLAAAAATILLLALSNGLLVSPRREENLRRLTMMERPLFVESHALVLANLEQLKLLVDPGAEVVTYWAGIPAFFSCYRMIDAQGYADRHIARRPLPQGLHWSTYVPGHVKRDPAYLLARRPDAFFQFWDLDTLPVQWPRHYMRRLGYGARGEYWLRRDSPYVRPGALPASGARSP